jgi:hypothetical protein
MQFMWADTLLALERAHLVRLIVWGGASLLVGSVLLGLMRIRGHRSALLDHFGIQTVAWGAIDLALALAGLHRIELRDLAGATRLDRFLWLNIGLDVGYILVGITLLAFGWRLGRRLGLVGAGLAVIVQGSALALLDLVLAGQISR